MAENDDMTDHRQLGVDLFNRTWQLLESREDDVDDQVDPHRQASAQ